MRSEGFARRWLVLALLSSAAAEVLAGGLGLAAAFDAARAYDPKYQAALREFDASREYRVQGRAALGPEVGLSASRARNQLDQSVAAVSRDMSYSSKSLAIQLRQPIYNAELQARSLEGEARSRQGEAVLTEQTSRLMLRLVEAYANVPLAEELLGTATAQVAALEEQVRSAGRLRTLGEGTVTDELEARSLLALAKVRMVEAMDARQTAMNRLATMVGSVQPAPRKLSAAFNGLPLAPADLPSWESLALERSPEIETRRHALQAARHGLDRTAALRQPRVEMLASVAKADSDSINTIDQSTYQRSIGVQLSVPLYDNGRNASQARQAAAAVGVAQATLDDVREATLADLRQHYRALLSEERKISAYTEALESATLQLQATRQSVKGGIRIPLDVLNAQAQRFSVQQELTQARFKYLKAWVRLRAAAGVLDASDLALIDQHLQ